MTGTGMVLAFMGLNPMELVIVGAVAVLLFGSRLPSVARSLGKSMTEFKKGMHDLQDEVRSSTSGNASSKPRYQQLDDRDEATAPKFEPPAADPETEPSAEESGSENIAEKSPEAHFPEPSEKDLRSLNSP